MNAEILAVGTEILLGDIVNTNARFLAQQLAELGIGVLHQSVVGDNPQRLADAVREALGRSDLLITTGGLGPTGDDITREIVSETLGLPLKLDEESFTRIKAFFEKSGREMTQNNRKQAMLPEGAVIFQNDWGTAPACAVEKGGKIVVMLPGPPREMAPIFDTYVRPYLMKFSDSTIYSTSLRVFGMGESAVEDLLGDRMDGANPTLAPYAKEGEVLLRITARAPSENEAEAMCAPMRDEIKSLLGDFIYGENVASLQQVVVEKLRAKKIKLGLSESCTGGLIAKRITEIPGSSEIFDCGVVSYANHTKSAFLGVRKKTLRRFGAVSAEVAAQMAEGARLCSRAGIGVGVTGIAGPDGGTPEKPVGLVYIGISDGIHCFVKKLMLGRGSKEREYIRYLAASHALDMVRRQLDGLPQDADTTQVRVPHPKLFAGGLFSSFSRAVWKDRMIRFGRGTFPHRGDSKKQVVFKLIFLALIIVFLVSFYQVANYYATDFGTRSINDSISHLYSGSGTAINPKDTHPSVQPSFAQLIAINKDVKGWVTVPDTHINYAVVQSSADTATDQYYLRRNVYGQYDRHGIPFLDYRCSLAPLGQNTIVYGHNMMDDLMFHDLVSYNTFNDNGGLDFYRKSPIVTFNTIYGNAKWKIFAVFIANTDPKDGPVFNYLVPTFSTQTDFNNYITQVRRRSLINTSVDVRPGDFILTLTTCTYEFTDARFVVEARMIRPGESDSVGSAEENPSPLMPNIWYQKFGGTAPVFHDSTPATASKASSTAAAKKSSSSASSAASAAGKTIAEAGTASSKASATAAADGENSAAAATSINAGHALT